MAPRLELFEFRYRDQRTGKWIQARYRAERHEIAARYVEFELIGDPEIRDVHDDARYFNPHRPSIGNLGPVLEIAGWKPARQVTVAGVAT